MTISENAFYGAKLTSIDIPNRVTSIGGGAFVNCAHLESVSIPASVTSIGAYAFGYCGKLAKVYIYAHSLETYGDMAFDYNAAGRKIYVLPDAVDTYKAGWSAYAADIEAMPTYAITLAEGTEDAVNWKVKVGEGEAQPFPVEGLEGGEKITATYSGEKKVKSVKAVKKAAVDPAKAYMKWNADQMKLVATEIPESFTTVTSSTTTWSAGTYVVEGEDVNITGTIELSGDVDLIIKDGAKLTAQGISGESKNLRIYGQANQSGQLVVGNSGTDAISNINTLEVYSAKVEATAYSDWSCGFFGISKFNVYGGLVDAKCTASTGCGIFLNGGESMNIYGGEVKAEGKGNNTDGSYGIICDSEDKATVTVYGGKLRAVSAQKAALYPAITLQKGAGFTGKIETSDDGTSWTDWTTEGTPATKYVRLGY